MAVKIRLKRMGKIRAPHYRIVVADARTKRDGKTIEEIGVYQPKFDPSVIQVDSDRAQHWLSVGAQPSEPVLAILKKTGDWQKFKGEPAPAPLLEQPTKTDKRAAFDAALAEAHAEPDTEAVSKKKTAKKASKKADKAESPAADSSSDNAAPAAAEQADSADEGEKSSESGS